MTQTRKRANEQTSKRWNKAKKTSHYPCTKIKTKKLCDLQAKKTTDNRQQIHKKKRSKKITIDNNRQTQAKIVVLIIYCLIDFLFI